MKKQKYSMLSYYLLFARRRWKLLLAMAIGVTIGRGISTFIPLLYKQFIDNLTSASPQSTILINIILFIFILNTIAWLGWRIFDIAILHFEVNTMVESANECFAYMHKHSYDFFVNNFAGSLVKKTYRLVKSFEIITDNIFLNVYPSLLLTAMGLFLLFSIQPVFSFILLVWFILFLIFNYIFVRLKLPLDRRANEIDSNYTGFYADTIINHATISQYSSLDRELSEFKKIGRDWFVAIRKSWYLSSFSFAVQGFMMAVTEFLLVYFGIRLWEQKIVTIGDFVLLQSLTLMIFWRLWDFGRYLRTISIAYADAQEMIDILNMPHAICDSAHAKPLKLEKGAISIRTLHFAYQKQAPVFHDFSLEISSYTKIALVSESGQGKSTLVKLLLRLYDVPKGSIFIDDQDITMVKQDSLRDAIAYVPQDPILFHRTLAENIAYGKEKASMKEIIAVSKKARCHEFISALKEGYDTYVGERGIKLSGGERQRIAIARAMLKDAPILILDEATSSLDSYSEQLIQAALKELMKKRTTLVIAHRLSTIMQMDEIIVLLKGNIAERGTHIELLNNPASHYKKLWEIQAGGFASQ